MTDSSEKQMSELLKRHISPLQGNLQRDLWPCMLSRMQKHPLPPMGWFEWALLSLLALLLLTSPGIVPILLYQL
jgi:hypothetical protein